MGGTPHRLTALLCITAGIGWDAWLRERFCGLEESEKKWVHHIFYDISQSLNILKKHVEI